MASHRKNNHLLFVIGTRPEAIKVAPLIKCINANSTMRVSVCSTGQHKEMLDDVFNIFDIVPDYDLKIMSHGQDLTDISERILTGLKRIISQCSPDAVIVHGDTTTSFIAALAAFYAHVDIYHLEAGLRTGSIKSPWPEEANRKLTATLANLHFAPTESARQNLLLENTPPESIFVTGNTVIDALHLILKKIENDQNSRELIAQRFTAIDFDKKIILVTGHRRENHGLGMNNLCSALIDIVHLSSDCQVVFPVHPNPNVFNTVQKLLGHIPNVHLIEPLSYTDFVFLMSKSFIIISDSGGIQEEAPSLGKPVLVTRDTTERPEAVNAGTVKLVGSEKASIVNEALNLITNENAYNEMSASANPYGDGKASDRILKILEARHLSS